MTPEQTRAECAAREARVDSAFDDVMSHATHLLSLYTESGLRRAPTSRTRAADLERPA